MRERPRVPTEAQDLLHARLILAALREGEPVSVSEIELVEGIVEHLVRHRAPHPEFHG